MYADDMVCFDESVHEIQLMFNTLHDYGSKWDLAINTDKIKIVVFLETDVKYTKTKNGLAYILTK